MDVSFRVVAGLSTFFILRSLPLSLSPLLLLTSTHSIPIFLSLSLLVGKLAQLFSRGLLLPRLVSAGGPQLLLHP